MLRLHYSRPDRLLAPTRPEVRPRTKRSVATTIHFGIGALCIQDLTPGRDLVSWNHSPVQVVRRDRSCAAYRSLTDPTKHQTTFYETA